MHSTEPARHEQLFFRQANTAAELEHALRHAVRVNARSMDDLHEVIKSCVSSLRAEGMQCEAALVTMKACVRHIGSKHSSAGLAEILYSDLLMEQIVRWSISEFYSRE